jgi:hypothetical protein
MKKHTLKKKDAEKKPTAAYVMPPPNDDAEAFGWSLGKLRHKDPNADPKDKDPWPGPYVFTVPTSLETRNIYGHNMDFICTGYVQMLLDSEPAIRAGAEKVKNAGYSPEAIKKFTKTVVAVFEQKIVPDIVERFRAVSDMVAEFYAARLAHIDKFGAEENEA